MALSGGKTVPLPLGKPAWGIKRAAGFFMMTNAHDGDLGRAYDDPATGSSSVLLLVFCAERFCYTPTD
jgi:hypothetical protein